MRIVIATGIYPPEVGGPALYAQGVKESLERSGHEVLVTLFGTLRKYPPGVRHILYAIRLFNASRGATAIFAFDTYSVGVPAAFIAMLRRIPVVIRVGGDFVWESYVERTHDLVPLSDFYHTPRALNFNERLATILVHWMLNNAQLAFNTAWLVDIWRTPYEIDPARAHIVENVVGERMVGALAAERSILLFGRQIALKNHEAFKAAFSRAHAAGADVVLVEGIVPHAELLEKIRTCYAVAIPSISDVAPNSIVDALRYGKPFLLTKYSGLAEKYSSMGIIVDPLDEVDMERGVREIADPIVYARLCANIAAYTEVRTYGDVAREMLAIVNK
jgi:glycosyltransferase involved in cell wall biosynthesis